MAVEYRKGSKLDEEEYGDKKIRQNRIMYWGWAILMGVIGGLLAALIL